MMVKLSPPKANYSPGSKKCSNSILIVIFASVYMRCERETHMPFIKAPMPQKNIDTGLSGIGEKGKICREHYFFTCSSTQ